MYKPSPPPGWNLLDEFHSPGDTARYISHAKDDVIDVVEVTSYGRIGDAEVWEARERGNSVHWDQTDIVWKEQLAGPVELKQAYKIAMKTMKRNDTTTDPEFDIGGGL